MEDKLNIIERVDLSGDGFGWEIAVYEDCTEIIYYEINEKGVKEIINKSVISACYDLQIFKKAIEMREKQMIEEVKK